MANKCDNCKRAITKAMPGVECAKCERLVHLSTKCTGLTSKQLTALKAASSLEWTCLECQSESPRRRSSIIIPEEDEEEDDNATVEINSKMLLGNISREVEKAIKKEMKELQQSIQFQSSKLDEVVECMEAFKKNIKDLERKNAALTNKNVNLEIRIGAMEQRFQEMEQEKLSRYVEVAGVSAESNDEAKKVITNIAAKLMQPQDGVKGIKNIQGRNDLPSRMLVELQDCETREKWIEAGKTTKPTVADIHPTEKSNKNPVYVREAMTKSNKQLFWQAKQELKVNEAYKYVWFRHGYVRARKDDKAKILIIKNVNDLLSIANSKAQSAK